MRRFLVVPVLAVMVAACGGSAATTAPTEAPAATEAPTEAPAVCERPTVACSFTQSRQRNPGRRAAGGPV